MKAVWRVMFTAAVACAYASLMLVLGAPWLHTGLVGACFGALGWHAFPELFEKQGRGFCEH